MIGQTQLSKAAPRGWIVAALVAIVLVPYGVLVAPGLGGIEVQAGGILLLTLVLGLVGFGVRGWLARILETPGWLWQGAGLWSAAALLGGLVGLVSGNEPTKVAGQVLALGLLPLGLLVGSLVGVGGREIGRGLVLAVAGAALLHFAAWLLAAAEGVAPHRLYLEGGASVAGLAPLALLLALGADDGLLRRFRRAISLVLGVYLLGAGSRGAWLAALIGITVFLLLGRGARVRFTPRRIAWASGLCIAAAAAWLGFGAWLERPRPNLLPDARPAELVDAAGHEQGLRRLGDGDGKGGIVWSSRVRKRDLGATFPVTAERTYRLRATLRGGQAGRGFVRLLWLDADGKPLANLGLAVPPGDPWTLVEAFGAAPPGSRTARLVVGSDLGSEGNWQLERLQLHQMGPGAMLPLVRQGAYLEARVASLWSNGPNVTGHQRSLDFRLAETRRLLALWREAPLGAKLFGHGLGATFELAGERLHYVHDFYAFLLFKLGLVGGGVVLLAALAWARGSVRTARSGAAGGDWAPAVAAAWCAYLAWAFTSPELTDFRNAPLFGLVLASLAGLRQPLARAEAARPLVVHVTTVQMSFVFLRGLVGHLERRGWEVQLVSSPAGEAPVWDADDPRPVVHEIAMARRIAPLADLAALARLVALFRRLEPSLVHTHTPKAGLLGMLAATICRVPVRVYHLRGLPHETARGGQRRLLRATEVVSCGLAHRVVAIGPSLRQRALDEGLAPARKLVVLGRGGNGVDALGRYDPARLPPETRARARAEAGIPAEALVVGFVGRRVRDKGIVELAQAWSTLAERFPAAHLLLVGPDEERDALPAASAAALAADPRVHLLPETRSVERWYAAMDLLVLPTYREGFPNTPMEAAAMGLPVVATRATGCVDAVEHGVTGTLVPVADAAALAAAIATYLDDEAIRRAHGGAGRRRVLAGFRRETVWQAVEALYAEESDAARAAGRLA